jgi:hypothetical protein
MKETIITYYVKDGILLSKISQNPHSTSINNESNKFERLVPRISKQLEEEIVKSKERSN